jgi:hypothetical protein
MFNFIKRILLTGQTYQGAPKEFSKEGFVDWDEINIARGVTFEEREPEYFTVRNQASSGSCVDQTIAKMIEEWDYVHDKIWTVYSATPGYQKRSNRPQPGRIGTEAMDWAINNGAWYEADVPSQNMSDAQMDSAYVDPDKKRKIRPNKKVLLPLDFYKVAQQIKDQNCVMLWFKCGMSEWQRDIPEGDSNSEAVRHSVCAVDCISYKGIEYIIIEDSWGKWLKNSDVPLFDGQRAITKKFFDKHVYFAGAFTEFKYEDQENETQDIKHEFKTILILGMKKDPEVKILQDVLKKEGLFPTSTPSTGNYLDLTRRAVLDFQVRYKVAPMAELKANNGKRVGDKTLAKLNELYNK